ncbi:MAG: glycine zipper 2TM domain-containing protein [Trinickia sp.]|jgi:osmotically inducible lipoprotein OsmB|uniref:glycine zipper 2TM domain-containing protein n=1 Tax=Trinickia sp. TaxID=2571163 RepID=UPI003F816552
MKRLGRLKFLCLTGAATVALLSGCTLGGAAVGGYAGNRLTHGSTVGTVGGAVAGGVVGYELGK